MSDGFDRLDAPPAEAWMSEPGHKIGGTVVEVSTGTGDYGPYPIAVVRVDEPEKCVPTVEKGAERAIFGFGTVLKDRLSTVQVGDWLGVKNLGLKDGAKGQYKNWAVVVESATPRKAAAPVAEAKPEPDEDELFG